MGGGATDSSGPICLYLTMPPSHAPRLPQVSHFWVEPTSVLTRHGEHMLGPQMEVSIALLVTMACWRGIAARLRL